MESTVYQQIFDQINKATRILIALPAHPNTDAVASGLAMSHFFHKLDKEVDVAATGEVPGNLSFLPGTDTIRQTLSTGKSLVVMVNIKTKPLDEVSYQTTEGNVSIYLKAKEGQYGPEDVSFASDKAPYDVVIILGSAALSDLGSLFDENADLFFETPKICVDNHASSEYFGAINLVDINATSVAEMLSGLFTAYEGQLVDEDIATCLLAGIVTQTNSFQRVQTTPQAFLKASELVSLGARQQEVIKYLYKTKSLSLLRLWGRALARLKMVDDLSLVYSLLALSDFGKAGADSKDVPQVLKELLDNISSYKIVALLCEVMGGGVEISLAAHHLINLETFGSALGASASVSPQVSGQFAMVVVSLPNTTLNDAEAKFVEAVQTILSPEPSEK